MKYRKPEIVDLGANMQRTNGQEWPTACISGAAASGVDESCGSGTSAGWTCLTGTAGPVGALCVGGSSPGGADDCFTGSSAYFCGSGSAGNTDPLGCRVGPSFS